MAEAQSVQTCKWGTPTLFLPWPYWCAASEDLWSCVRGRAPRGVTDPRVCAVCRHWSAAPAIRHDEDDHLGSTAP